MNREPCLYHIFQISLLFKFAGEKFREVLAVTFGLEKCLSVQSHSNLASARSTRYECITETTFATLLSPIHRPMMHHSTSGRHLSVQHHNVIANGSIRNGRLSAPNVHALSVSDLSAGSSDGASSSKRSSLLVVPVPQEKQKQKQKLQQQKMALLSKEHETKLWVKTASF